jgi:hypothetical protein
MSILSAPIPNLVANRVPDVLSLPWVEHTPWGERGRAGSGIGGHRAGARGEQDRPDSPGAVVRRHLASFPWRVSTAEPARATPRPTLFREGPRPGPPQPAGGGRSSGDGRRSAHAASAVIAHRPENSGDYRLAAQVPCSRSLVSWHHAWHHGLPKSSRSRQRVIWRA